MTSQVKLNSDFGFMKLKVQTAKALTWRDIVLSLPGAGAALLPVGGCPACWPVYSAVLGAFGLTFLLHPGYLFLLSSTLLMLGFTALASRAKRRRRYGPLMLGGVSVVAILFFKFGRVFGPLVYAGLAGLMIALFWNGRPTRSESAADCPGCLRAVPKKSPPSSQM